MFTKSVLFILWLSTYKKFLTKIARSFKILVSVKTIMIGFTKIYNILTAHSNSHLSINFNSCIWPLECAAEILDFLKIITIIFYQNFKMLKLLVILFIIKLFTCIDVLKITLTLGAISSSCCYWLRFQRKFEFQRKDQ